MKKALFAIVALGLLLFSTPTNSTQDVAFSENAPVVNHPILPPV
jgi:hypothetical protein